MIRILIADDHHVVRTGIRAILERQSDMDVVAEVSDGYEAVQKALDLTPDIVVMDLAMPRMDGFSATHEIKQRCPNTNVVALTVHDDEEYLFRLLRAGGSGYVLKEAAARELADAIRTVYRGEASLHPSQTRALIREFVETASERDPQDPLTQQEREVLKLAAEGYTNQQIAEILKRNIHTIESHRAHIMEKLEFENLSDLIRYAIRHRIIEL